MGSSQSTSNAVKNSREKDYLNSEEYRDFSEKIKTKEYLEEENALKNENISDMSLFHSYMPVPSITTTVVHTYCLLSNRKLRNQNKVILIEYGGYYGFSKTCKETPHYPLENGYRYIFTDGYFDNGFDGLAIAHKIMPFYKIIEHLNSQNWRSKDYNLSNHNCQYFIKELIILLECELFYETIPLRCTNFEYPRFMYSEADNFPQHGIFEIPSTLIDGLKNVFQKRKKNNEELFYESSPFLTLKFKFKKFDHEIRRLGDTNHNGFNLIYIYDYVALKDFKVYYKDFVKYYEEKEAERKEMAECFKPIYYIFKKNN